MSKCISEWWTSKEYSICEKIASDRWESYMQKKPKMLTRYGIIGLWFRLYKFPKLRNDLQRIIGRI